MFFFSYCGTWLEKNLSVVVCSEKNSYQRQRSFKRINPFVPWQNIEIWYSETPQVNIWQRGKRNLLKSNGYLNFFQDKSSTFHLKWNSLSRELLEDRLSNWVIGNFLQHTGSSWKTQSMNHISESPHTWSIQSVLHWSSLRI